MDTLAFNIGDAFGAPIQAGDPGPLISNFVSVVLVVAGIVILFMFIIGGIGMIRSAGDKNPEEMAKARKALTYAIVGFLVVFTSFWVIQLIEYTTGSNFVTNPRI